MNVALKRMSVDEFIAWCDQQPRGRYELVDGQVVEMNAQRLTHIDVKYAVHAALKAALANTNFRVVGDGLSVKIDLNTAFEPDALVYQGPRLPPDTVYISVPILVVEVLSPGTKTIDTTKKLEGYFKLPSVRQYMIVDPDTCTIVHHARDTAGAIATHVMTEGMISLNAVGATLRTEDCFEA